MQRPWVRILTPGVLLVLAACAQSGDPAARTPAAMPAAASAPGMRVFIDPATGEARAPTRAESAAATAGDRLQRAAVVGQAASEGTQREHFVLADGTEGVKLAPRDRHAVVVCRQADGSFGSNCPPLAGTARP
jgi:hypothetical protein